MPILIKDKQSQNFGQINPFALKGCIVNKWIKLLEDMKSSFKHKL